MNIKKQRKIWAKNGKNLRASTAGLGNKIVDETLYVETKSFKSVDGKIVMECVTHDVTIKEPTRFNRKTQQFYFANNRPNADQIAVTANGANLKVMSLLKMGVLRTR